MSTITVIVPVLNGMPYLTETLESLENQTLRDFEVILWDNGSTDGTVEEAARWIPSRVPGKVVSDRPLPLHECLATMVEEADSEFCARLDADDICTPDRLEVQLRAFRQDEELVALGAQARYIDPQGRLTGDGSDFPLEDERILAAMLMENQLLHPTVMFRRQAILTAGNYRIPKPCEDFDLWLRVSRVGKIRNLADTLLNYRIHPASIIAQARANNELEAPNGDCIANLSGSVFGIPDPVYRELRGKSKFLALGPLIAAAKAIANRSGKGIFEVAMSREFVWSARCLTRRQDLVSRICWGLFERVGRLMKRN